MQKKIAHTILLIVLAGALVAILYAIYLETHRVEILKQSNLSLLLAGEKETLYFQERVKFSDCEARGPLPDPECTPGAIFEDATVDEICVSGYSKTVRNVSVGLKAEVFAEYGIEYPVLFGSYEIDHLIPLALGGSNEMANLWPKSAEPFPGFYEKNLTGNYLREEVCDGRVSLAVAQERIAQDWFSIYNNISEEKIRELKSKYKNWAK